MSAAVAAAASAPSRARRVGRAPKSPRSRRPASDRRPPPTAARRRLVAGPHADGDHRFEPAPRIGRPSAGLQRAAAARHPWCGPVPESPRGPCRLPQKWSAAEESSTASGGSRRPSTSIAARRTCGAGSCSSSCRPPEATAAFRSRPTDRRAKVPDPRIDVVERDQRAPPRRLVHAGERRRGGRPHRRRVEFERVHQRGKGAGVSKTAGVHGRAADRLGGVGAGDDPSAHAA